MLSFLQGVGAQVGPWLYVIAGLLAFGEAAIMIGLVVPGETALLVGGFGAHQGWINLGPMIAIAIGSAIGGDSVGYELGRRLGPALKSSRLGQRIGAQRWADTEDFVHRHGGKAVFLGRFTAVLRALTPGLAGVARMPYLTTFLPWNVAGGVVWGAGCVLLGYGLSASLATVGRDLTYGPLLAMAVGIAVLIAVKVRRRPSNALRTRRIELTDHHGHDAAQPVKRIE